MRTANPPQAVETLLRALFEGTRTTGPWVDHRPSELEMAAVAPHDPLDLVVPYQYLLLTLVGDETRAMTRQAAEAVRAAAKRLLALLDLYRRAVAGPDPQWARFVTLCQAPFPVQRPARCDLRDPAAVAVMVREARFDGSWRRYLEWLEEHGTDRERRLTGRRIRELAAFEEAYGVDLADLFFSGQERWIARSPDRCKKEV